MAEAMNSIEDKVDRGQPLTRAEVAEVFASVEASLKRALVSEFLFPPRSAEDALDRVSAWAELRDMVDERIDELSAELA